MGKRVYQLDCCGRWMCELCLNQMTKRKDFRCRNPICPVRPNFLFDIGGKKLDKIMRDRIPQWQTDNKCLRRPCGLGEIHPIQRGVDKYPEGHVEIVRGMKEWREPLHACVFCPAGTTRTMHKRCALERNGGGFGKWINREFVCIRHWIVFASLYVSRLQEQPKSKQTTRRPSIEDCFRAAVQIRRQYRTTSENLKRVVQEGPWGRMDRGKLSNELLEDIGLIDDARFSDEELLRRTGPGWEVSQYMNDIGLRGCHLY